MATTNAISSATLDFGPTLQYCLVIEDSEYLFSGSEVSRDYVSSLWTNLEVDNLMPEVTVILVTSETLEKITSSNKVRAFATPLLPKMDSYLILATFEEYKQFVESLQGELFRFTWMVTLSH